MAENRGKLNENPGGSGSTFSMDLEARLKAVTVEDMERQYPNCKTCNLSYETADGLECHNKECHLDQVEKCFDCGTNFKTKDILKNHIRSNHKNEYQCTVDGKRFLNIDELSEHMRQFHNGFDFLKCSECEKIFNNQTDLNTHFYFDHTLKCFFCSYGTISSYENYLFRHIVTCQSQKWNSELICPICKDRQLISKEDFIQHFIQNHSDIKIFECSNKCPEIWFKEKDLENHMTKCPRAKHKMRRESNRKRKIQDKKGDKSSDCKEKKEYEPDDPEYVCEVNSCNIGFDSIIDFICHLRSEHSKEEEEKLQKNGSIFMLSFKIESNQFGQLVIRPISEDKFLFCGRCKRFIYDMNEMKKHNESFHNRTNFCNACGSAFKSQKELDNHSHHHEKIKCFWEDCEGYFNSETVLGNHVKIHNKLFQLEEAIEKLIEILGSKSSELSNSSKILPVRNWCAFCKIKLSTEESASHSCMSIEGETAASSKSLLSDDIYSFTSQELEKGDSNTECQPQTLPREKPESIDSFIECEENVLSAKIQSNESYDADESE